MMDYQKVKAVFSNRKQVVITAHKSPDGDAIGSSLALMHLLNAGGHQAKVIVPDAFPKFLDWMHGSDSIQTFDQAKEVCVKQISEAEVIFSLDYNNLDRAGDIGPEIQESTATKVLIDHHLFPDTGFDHTLSNTDASSTAELVFEFIQELGYGIHLNAKIAECLYTGLVTDTGSFRFSSTTAKTHLIVSELINAGLDHSSVHQKIYDNNSLSSLRLKGYALSEKLEIVDSKAAIIPISLKEKNRFKYQKGDTEGLVNYGLSVDGVEVAVLLSEELGFVKFSFRSKGLVNVNELARKAFNGGGHRNAAGGKLDCNIEEAIIILKTELAEISYDY